MTPIRELIAVELGAILGRKSGKALLILACIAGISAPAIMFKLQETIDSRHIQAVIGEDIAISMMRGLAIYNLLIAPLMIPIIASQSLAGEWRSKQLHMTLTAPISRWGLLNAKTVAICITSGVGVLLMCLLILLISSSRYNSFGAFNLVGIACFLSLLAHAAIAGITFMIATWTQKTKTCAAFTMFVLLLFTALHIIFKLPILFLPASMKEMGPIIANWMPFDALMAWSGWKSGFGIAPTRLSIGLLLLFAALKYRFERVNLK